MLHVKKKRDGGILVSLPLEDAEVLRSLPGRLRRLLETPDSKDKVLQRLFPPAYLDAKKQAEYEALVGGALRGRKLECVKAFEATLGRWKVEGQRVDVSISGEEFELWLGFVNDMRLMIGTELDIEDDDWNLHPDPSHPRAPEFALLDYLTWLEESLLRARDLGWHGSRATPP